MIFTFSEKLNPSIIIKFVVGKAGILFILRAAEKIQRDAIGKKHAK